MTKQLGEYIEKLMIEREAELIRSGVVKSGRRLSRNYMAKEILNVSGTWFNDVVNGKSEPSDELLIKISNFFDVDERYMFLVAERVHPVDFEDFKEKYLDELKNKYSKHTHQ